MSTELIVFSGGLDSATLLTERASKSRNVRAIYVDIGYLPSVAERNSAKNICYRLDVPLEIVNLSGIFDMVTGFVPIELLGKGELDKGQPTPITSASDYVSGFSVILSVASHYAQLGEITNIYVALTQEQLANSRDGGLGTYLEGWAALLTTLNSHRPIRLHYPYGTISKADVVRKGVALGVNLERTWSCYDRETVHCGRCPGCLSRKIAFRDASITDPTMYTVDGLGGLGA